jgi:hypothetical protein
MNLHIYANPETYYPNKYIFNWIGGEHIRLIRNSGNPEVYFKAIKEFRDYLIRRNYPKDEIQVQMENSSYLQRTFWLRDVAKKADDFTEDEKTNRIFVHNIPGRHFLIRLAKDAWKIAFPDPYFRPKVDYIVFRGTTLKRITQKHNKAILSATSGGV